MGADLILYQISVRCKPKDSLKKVEELWAGGLNKEYVLNEDTCDSWSLEDEVDNK